MTDLQSLISRLEKAEGPDRELDGRIHCILAGVEFVRWDGAGAVVRHRDGIWKGGIGHFAEQAIRPYTRSLDAAMTLVPEGCGWLVGCEREGRARANVWRRSILRDIPPPPLQAPTPALALCIAALKAIQETNRG